MAEGNMTPLRQNRIFRHITNPRNLRLPLCAAGGLCASFDAKTLVGQYSSFMTDLMREGDRREKIDVKIDVESARQPRLYQRAKSAGLSPVRVAKKLSERNPFHRKGLSGTRASRTQDGFTLVELLVVLTILSLLIALVAPAMIRQLGSAKHKIAEQSIERIAGVLDVYRLDVGSYPSTAQGLAALNDNPGNVTGWNGPYLKDASGINDPWGRPFQYRSPSQRAKHSFDITSLGADGKTGGEGEDADLINR
jgi:general secretion pathway protein G